MWNETFKRRGAVLAVAAMVGLSSGCLLGAADNTFKNPGITNPSEQRGLNFNVPGVVSKVMVKEGDIVKKGDIIAQQDDSVDLADLKVKQADVTSSALQIEAAAVDLAQKKVELDRDTEMFKKKVISSSDYDKAKLDVDIGEIRVKLAQQETQQKQEEVEAEKAKIAQKKLVSTIDGIVQKINVHEGELATNDPKTPCIQIVLNEPLYVEVDIPVATAAGLALKQKMDVRYAGDDKWHVADIIFFNPVASAAAGTQRIRLQMENPSHMRSGMQVEVGPFDPKHAHDAKDVAVAVPAR
ncbi:MAG TPA: efflux RND transporter periplasmic adaptor subunit [Tepidisphaeraceae bacterium]|jgi:RND family efflux transporter MFP subunit|nr:efflux RND transporter periplasmic adaptor subunit [Tepidisphaeraceae bacterium]